MDDWHQYQRDNIRHFIQAGLLSGSVVPAVVGRALGCLSGANPSHGMKRIYRFLDNDRITDERMCEIYLTRFKAFLKILKSKRVVIAVDWTVLFKEFNLLSAALVTGDGRTIPIAYTGYMLGNIPEYESQNSIEERFLKMVIAAIPSSYEATFIADRGFDRPQLAAFFQEQNVKYIIRSSVNTWVTIGTQRVKLSVDTIAQGETRDFGTVTYTDSHPIELRLVGAWHDRMKEPWYLLTNLETDTIQSVLNTYARRMEIEEMFKSKKNGQSGMSWRHCQLETIERWLRLAFLVTLVFQFLAEIALSIPDDWKSYEKRYTLCRRERRVFSFYTLSRLIIQDSGVFYIELEGWRLRVKEL
jgi:hypothetical protein